MVTLAEKNDSEGRRQEAAINFSRITDHRSVIWSVRVLLIAARRPQGASEGGGGVGGGLILMGVFFLCWRWWRGINGATSGCAGSAV